MSSTWNPTVVPTILFQTYIESVFKNFGMVTHTTFSLHHDPGSTNLLGRHAPMVWAQDFRVLQVICSSGDHSRQLSKQLQGYIEIQNFGSVKLSRPYLVYQSCLLPSDCGALHSNLTWPVERNRPTNSGTQDVLTYITSIYITKNKPSVMLSLKLSKVWLYKQLDR